jgi:hypothetical protein
MCRRTEREFPLYEIKPGAVLGSESEFEAMHRLTGKPSFGQVLIIASFCNDVKM